jgi:hypothetical protein
VQRINPAAQISNIAGEVALSLAAKIGKIVQRNSHWDGNGRQREATD